MFKTKHKLLLPFLLILFLFSTITAFAGGEVTVRDITYYPDIEAPTHPHIWQYRFDDSGHWRECTVCHYITSKQNHTKYVNNGTKWRMSQYQDDCFRDVCNCGWQGPAQRVLPGRWENWKDAGKFYDVSWRTFDSVRMISRSEYNTLLSNGTYPARPQGYTFTAVSGNMGYVFAGGAVPGNTGVKGVKSTLVLCGSYDGFGSRSAQTIADEFSKLCQFSGNGGGSRYAFLSTIPSSVGSSHPLYGMYSKYASMSDAVFNRIMTYFVGMSEHGISWGCGSTGGHHCSYQTMEQPGAHWWYESYCTTSSGKHMTMYDEVNGGGTCAVCGTSCTGAEHLTYIHYEHQGNYGTTLKQGTTGTWSNPEAMYYMRRNNIVSNTKVQWRRVNRDLYQCRLYIQPSAHCCVTNGAGQQLAGYGQAYTSGWHNVGITDSLVGSWYTWITDYWVYDRNYGGKRQIATYSPYAMIDVVDPVAYGQGNSSYWQLTGNGTKDKTSTQATIKCTFSDNLDYSANQIFVQLLDSDKKTWIPQDNGVRWKGLNTLRSGVWQGTLDVPTEVNGTKTIYVQAKDSTGNVSALIPISVSYIDAKGPELTLSPVDEPNTVWTRTKTVTIKGQDAFNNVKIGLSEKPDGMVVVSNDEYGYERTITFTGNVTDPKAVAIFGQDFTGNLSYKDVIIAKLDNTIPIVKYEGYENFIGYTDVTLSGTDYQVTSKSQKDAGSGVKYYGVSTSPDEEPTEWQTSPIIKITETGTYYFWDKDGVDWVSEPTEGVYVPVHWKLFFDFDKPDISTSELTDNSPAYKIVTHLEQIGAMPDPKITGWTFMGWRLLDRDETTRPDKLITYTRTNEEEPFTRSVPESLITFYDRNVRSRAEDVVDIHYNTIYEWKESKTAQAEWRENRYTIRWNDTFGNVYEDGVTYLYDHDYEAPTQVDTGFENPGYYIAYWIDIPKESIHVPSIRYWSKDEDWPVGYEGVLQSFRNLTAEDDGVVDMYAVWKPIPYVIRLVDNYAHATEPYKDYDVFYDTLFRFPYPKLWDHGENATHIGYDRTALTYANPEWPWNQTVTKLTVERNAVVPIYLIWDNKPTISCEPEYYLNATEVAVNGLAPNDAAVTKTNLEAWLLTKCVAKDWEWTERYGTAVIPPGENRGYTFKVTALEPAKMSEQVKYSDALTYFVTFEVTDDAGQTSTARMTLYVSDKVNILIN